MVFDKVRSIIVNQLDVDEDKVTMNANIQEDLGADSLDVVDLVMSFEEEFDVESHILWLPDVFGYSAALPQILKKAGVDRFITHKISSY